MPSDGQERWRWSDVCELRVSKELGRYLVAARPIGAEETVLVASAAAAVVLPSYKKRLCAFCYLDTRRRLTLSCSECHW